MIEFSKITKTLDGYPCHYFGTRISPVGCVRLHVFAVFTSTGVSQADYNDSGDLMLLSVARNRWQPSKTSRFQIVNSEVPNV